MWLISTIKDASWAIDLWLFHLINGFCGNWIFDWAARFIEKAPLFTGGLILAAYWWVWFLAGPLSEKRVKIIAAIIGAVFALIVSRAIAKGLPFRVRPLYTEGIDYRPPQLPSEPIIGGWEQWNAFPSDHAAWFFALAGGLWRCSRIAGSLGFVVAAMGIAVVRIYLGIHYPSDVLAGGAIGLLCVYAVGRINILGVAGPVIKSERKYPPVFYAVAFLISLELALTFGDVRLFLRGLLLVLQKIGVASLDLTGALFLLVGALVPVALAGWLLIKLLSRRRRESP